MSVAKGDEGGVAIGVGRQFWSCEERRLGAMRVVSEVVADGSGSGGGPPSQRACSFSYGHGGGRRWMKEVDENFVGEGL